jgi:hypothetical protein
MAKQSYVKLLKEAITDWDTSKQVDIKGPFLDPILSYKGDGELATHKDAASILERYYFGETDSRIMVEAEEEGAAGDTEINDLPSKEDSGVGKEKDQIEKEITEQEETDTEEKDEDDDEKEEGKEEEVKEQEEVKDADKKEDKEEKPAEITEQLENAIIEKLIEEMELQEEEVPGDKGEGTQAAGTGTAEKQVPDRKDMTKEQEEVVPAGEEKEEDEDKEDEDKEEKEEVEEAFKIFKEQIEAEEKPADDKKKDDEVLDIDKELDNKKDLDKEIKKEQLVPSAVPGGPGPNKKEGMDKDELEEAYRIFKEVVEDDDIVPVDSKKVRV